jgi:hypothetical protein
MKKRKNYKVGDYVLFTKGRKFLSGPHTEIITYITMIEAIQKKPGNKPYRIIGFNHYVGRKQLSSPTKEHILRYKLVNFYGAVQLNQL